MKRYTLDDHLELVREALVAADDWDVKDAVDLRGDMQLIQRTLQVLEARLDGGQTARRANARKKAKRDGRLTGYEDYLPGV